MLTCHGVPPPLRDYSILSSYELKAAQLRAAPKTRDPAIEEEQERIRLKHDATMKLVSGWQNTVASNRLERRTRLQREAEVEEQRKRALDEEERKLEKLKKQASLAEARKKGFVNRPEVRAVNSQLLLQEVLAERQAQETFKERKKIREMQRQMEEDAMMEQKYKEMCEKEERIRQERKEMARKAAEGFIEQKQLKEMLKKKEREEEKEDERILKQEYIRADAEEKAKEAARKEKLRQQYAEAMVENKNLEFFKERQKELEKREDERIRQLFIQQMDEMDARAEAEKKRREDIINARASLIEAERKRQEMSKKEEQDFLDKQLRDQYQKESKRIAELTAKKQRLLAERRSEMQEAMRMKLYKEKLKKSRKIFPDPVGDAEEEAMYQRIAQKEKNRVELAAFQLQQIREKKEWEASEKEREKLEFLAQLEKDKQELAIAQEYAKKLIAQSEEMDNQ